MLPSLSDWRPILPFYRSESCAEIFVRFQTSRPSRELVLIPCSFLFFFTVCISDHFIVSGCYHGALLSVYLLPGYAFLCFYSFFLLWAILHVLSYLLALVFSLQFPSSLRGRELLFLYLFFYSLIRPP